MFSDPCPEANQINDTELSSDEQMVEFYLFPCGPASSEGEVPGLLALLCEKATLGLPLQ